MKSAVVQSLLAVFYSATHDCITDSSLVFLVTISMYLLHTALHSEGRKKLLFYVLYYFAAAAAVMAKGFVGLAFSVTLFAFWVAWTRDWKEILRAQPWLGVAIVGAVVGTWIYYLGATGSWDYVHTFLIQNNVLRFLPFLGVYGGSHEKPLYQYLGKFWEAFAPWCILVPAVFAWVWRTRNQDKNRMFLLLWFVSGFILLSAAGTKRNIYLAPLSAPFAIMTALYLHSVETGEVKDRLSRVVQVILVVCCALAPLGFVVGACLADLCSDVTFVLFPPILAIAFVMLLRQFLKDRKANFALLSVLFFLTFVAFTCAFHPHLDKENSVKRQCLEMKRILDERKQPLYALMPSEFSRGAIPFYTGHFMICLRDFDSVEEVAQKGDALILIVDRTKDLSLYTQVHEWFPEMLFYGICDYGKRPMWLLGNGHRVRTGDEGSRQ
jgi:4-amino-4-deoxy-L-arabinose transferase-like glycosyltransferase